MFLNQFESSDTTRLHQILNTLESTYGVSIKIDLNSPTAESSLHECRVDYETRRDAIIKESAFNSYQQNPEYTKSLLILEAVKLMLTEISPKRRRNRKVAESRMDITDYIQDAVIAAGSPGTTYYRVQDALKMLGSKIPSFHVNDETRRHISNAWKLFNNMPVDAVGRDFLPINSELSKAKHAAMTNNQKFSQTSESIAEMEEGALKDAGRWLKKSADEFWNGTPEELERERAERDAYIAHRNEIPDDELDEAAMTPEQIQRAIALGREMMAYSAEQRPQNDADIALMNAFSKVGDKLTQMGTEFGPRGLTDTEQKIMRLAQLKLKAAGKLGTNELMPKVQNYIGPTAGPATMPIQQIAEGLGSTHHYEYQASMARSELYRNTKYAMSLMKQIDPHGEVKPWIAASLAKAANYLDKIYHYLEYKSTFEPTSIQNEMDGDADLDANSGETARHNLTQIAEYSIKIFEMIAPDDKIEGWVSMKLTTASECVSSAKHYMDYVQFEKHGLDNHFMEGRRMTRKHVAESLLIEQDQEELAKAQTILAAKDMSSKLQGMAEDVAKMAVEDLMPLVDVMRQQFGPEAADGFNQTAKAALETLLNTTTESKEQFDSAVDTLSSGGIPSQLSDLEDAPVMPGTDATIPADTSDMSADLADLTGAEPPEGDDMVDEPALGRAKKPPMAEGKRALPPGFKNKGWNKNVTKDKKTSDKDDDKKSINEKSPPGKKAEDFIKSNKENFKKRYGKNAENYLYATAWKKFGPKTEAFICATRSLAESKNELSRLEQSLSENKKEFSKLLAEGKVADPLNIGYGLEGEVIIHNMNTVSKKIAEAKTTITTEMNDGISKIIKDIENSQTYSRLAETKEKTPYGVIFTTATGKKGTKMFESEETRNYWLELRGNSVKNIQLIEPDTFDKAMKNFS